MLALSGNSDQNGEITRTIRIDLWLWRARKQPTNLIQALVGSPALAGLVPDQPPIPNQEWDGMANRPWPLPPTSPAQWAPIWAGGQNPPVHKFVYQTSSIFILYLPPPPKKSHNPAILFPYHPISNFNNNNFNNNNIVNSILHI